MEHHAPKRADVDTEKAFGTERLVGFAQVASRIASDGSRSGAIFRTFDENAARDLLYMETKLAILAKRQRELDEEDAWNPFLQPAARSLALWEEMLEDDSRANDFDKKKLHERKALALEMRKMLKEYYKALRLYSQILALPKPTQRNLKAWEVETKLDLQGVAEARLNENMKYSLCALREQRRSDPISKFCMNYLPSFFSRPDQDLRPGNLNVPVERIEKTVSAIATALAFGLLFGAIEALYRVESHSVRLGILAGFILAFAIVVGLFTGAKRTEIFAATAAYAAVLVVYVGENPAHSNGTAQRTG